MYGSKGGELFGRNHPSARGSSRVKRNLQVPPSTPEASIATYENNGELGADALAAAAAWMHPSTKVSASKQLPSKQLPRAHVFINST